MPRVIKHMVVTETQPTYDTPAEPVVVSSTRIAATTAEWIEYVIYFIFGVIQVLLAFRLILKLTGASPASSFVRAIYNGTSSFISPFEGMFSRVSTPGAETMAVFEPSTLIAIIVYAVMAWGIVMVLRIFSGEHQLEE